MESPEGRSAVSVKTVDLVVALTLLLCGLLVMWDSHRIGASWGDDGPAAGYFPFYIGLILVVSAMVNMISALRRLGRPDSFVGVNALRLVATVLIPTVGYVALIGGIGPIPGLGIYVPSAMFIAAFMFWLGHYRWHISAVTGIVVTVLFFLMFEVWFKVPLPKGPLEAALGLN